MRMISIEFRAGKRAGATRDGGTGDGTGAPTLAGAGAGTSGIGCPTLTISTGGATPGVSAAQPSEATTPIAKPAMMIALIKRDDIEKPGSSISRIGASDRI